MLLMSNNECGKVGLTRLTIGQNACSLIVRPLHSNSGKQTELSYTNTIQHIE